jgi:hypothetical protein
MATDYSYTIGQCDIPAHRRAALESFRDKRRLWLSWLDTDEHHAIWTTLHSMVWTEVAFKTLAGIATDNDENALNNPLVSEALLSGHVANQVLAIRRLMENTQKDRISLRRLLTDLRRNFNLFTRENYVCFGSSSRSSSRLSELSASRKAEATASNSAAAAANTSNQQSRPTE